MADVLESALQLALRQQNLPRQELNTMYARTDQAGQQVMQNAQAFSSMADRAAQRQQQEAQFNIMQDFRNKELAVQKDRGMAEIALANQRLANEQLNYKMTTQQADQQPMIQAANATFTTQFANVVQGGKTPADITAGYNKIIQDNPDIAKYMPPHQLLGYLQQGILAVQDRIGQQRAIQDQINWNAKIDKLETLGPQYGFDIETLKTQPDAPNAFVTPNGAYDRTAVQQVLPQLEAKDKAAQDELTQQNIEKNANARERGRLQAMTDYGMTNSGKPIEWDASGLPHEQGDPKPLTKTAALSNATTFEKMSQTAPTPELATEYKAKANRLYNYATPGITSGSPGTKKPILDFTH